MNYIDIVFDGPPSHESGRFVEVESPEGTAIRIGKWIEDSPFWRLRIPSLRVAGGTSALLRDLELFLKASHWNGLSDKWDDLEAKQLHDRVLAALGEGKA